MKAAAPMIGGVIWPPAEDAASTALLRAVETWPRGGEPDNPSAWLWTVAYNALMGELRTRAPKPQNPMLGLMFK